ncbi:MAG: M48 family metallopeptidase [Gammaproteobacteria bacterium]
MATFDFRAAQESARRDSILLVLGFVAMVLVIGAIIGTLGAVALQGEAIAAAGVAALEPATVLGIAAAVIVGIAAVALIRIAMLGSDGAKVAQSLGGHEVTEDATNPYHRRYLNVVHEMAIAAGLPPPRAFVIKNEKGINAFAAGADPERAAVGVTHGALSKLTREELSGVVAHEMAHIAHRDTRLNTRLMGMVFGLVVLYWLGRAVMRSFMFRRWRGRGGNRSALPALVLAIGLIVVGLLGVLCGRMLQSAVSRRREALADAGAVQFTRNPRGLANALKKIGATAEGSRVGNAHAEEARHLFFAEAAGGLAGLFATHPPLVERIRALEPGFDPASDPVWRMDDRAILQESRAELALGPWDRRNP